MILPYVLFLSLVTNYSAQLAIKIFVSHIADGVEDGKYHFFSLIPSQNMHRKHCLAANLPRTQNKLSWMNYHLQNDSATRALLAGRSSPRSLSHFPPFLLLIVGHANHLFRATTFLPAQQWLEDSISKCQRVFRIQICLWSDLTKSQANWTSSES